jgi:prepilin-type processing-associated H-X9-DG protein
MKINQLARDIQSPNPYPGQYSTATTPPTGGLAYARPSSAHPGGVNVMFCDNHYRFIAEDIPYHVFTQLMTPRQKGVTQYVKPPMAGAWNYLINEADYSSTCVNGHRLRSDYSTPRDFSRGVFLVLSGYLAAPRPTIGSLA